MPELPEAETIARELNRRLAGYALGKVCLSRSDIVHGDPRPLDVLLNGRRVERVRRRAKRVILDLESEAESPSAGASHPPSSTTRGERDVKAKTELIFRLGMSGRLTLVPSKTSIELHTHLRIAVPALESELRFCDPRRFGGVWCLAGGSRHVGKRLGEVGVEPLETTPGVFRRILTRRRQIKALLMDQRIIGGLGNIYCDESLHAAGIHPLRHANMLDSSEATGLLRAVKSTLRRAIRHNGSTLRDYRRADGQEGSFQRYHRVYGREGKPCRNCGTPITRIIAAGRSTFLCRCCQPRQQEKRRKV